MAIPCSDAFKAAWAQKRGSRELLKAEYRRIYYDASSSPPAMRWETSWRPVPGVCKFGRIQQALDVPKANIYRISEVVIEVENLNNRWIPSIYVPSVFAADEFSDIGYQGPFTQVRIYWGYILANGDKEYIGQFTGVLTKSPAVMPGGATAELTISSMLLRLKTSEAEDVSEDFEEEALTPGPDGTNKDFYTTSTGVDHISLIEATNPAFSPPTYQEVDQGDWQISDTNALTAAKISFADPPLAGAQLRATGRRWKNDLPIETILGLLFTNAGFGASEYEIRPILFPGGLYGRKTIDSQEEWEACALDNIDSKSDPGSIKQSWWLLDNFADGDYTDDPTWTVYSNAGYVSVAGGWMTFGANSPDSYVMTTVGTPFTPAYGTFAFSTRFSINPATGFSLRVYFILDSAAVGPYGLPWGRGYFLYLSPEGVRVYRNPYGGYPIAMLFMASGDYSGEHEWRISRESDGTFHIYVRAIGVNDWTDLGSFIDNTFTVGGFFLTSISGSSSYPCTGSIGQIYYTPAFGDIYQVAVSSNAPVAESPEYDLLSTPSAFGRIQLVCNTNGGSVVAETSSGDVSGALGPWIQVAADWQILSTPGQYFKFRVKPISSGFSSPVISKATASFTVSTVNVSVANHTNKKGLDAAERYIQIADYEIGCDYSGKAFVRSKSAAGAYVVHLTQSNGIIDVLEYDAGDDPNKNEPCTVGKVRYNGYYNEYSGVDAGEVEPTLERRYRTRAQSDDFSDIMLANDVNLAAPRAQLYYENGSILNEDGTRRPKRKLKLKIWHVPWLELSDVVRISYFEHPLMRQMIAGDPLNRWGSEMLGELPQNVIARDWDMKVIEYIPDLDNPEQTIMTVEEFQQ